MNDYLRTLYAMNLSYCRRLLEDVGEDEMLTQPASGVNPPAWILGHLSLCTDYALDFMGQPKRLPDQWHALFGPQTGLPEKTACPTKQELWEAYESGHSQVHAASIEVGPELLDKPNPLPFKFLQQTLPTTGDLLAHLMATHEAAHIGHLSNWRRQMGRAPLF